MLRRDDDPLYLDRALTAVGADLVANRHLGLAVRAQVPDDVRLAHLRQPVADVVREHDRHGHQLVRLRARVPEHHPLVAGAHQIERVVIARRVPDLVCLVYPLGDVRRLPVDREDDPARVAIEPVLRPVVADLADLLAHEARDVHVRRRRQLTCDDNEAGRHQGLAGNPPRGVPGQDRVEDGVRDLIGDLVRMTFRDRLRRERERARHDGLTIAMRPHRRRAEPDGVGCDDGRVVTARRSPVAVGDLVAGLSVAAVLVPQSLAYAQVAGMPAYRGLYAAALPPIAAALFASSPYLQTGPVALTALLTFGALSAQAPPGSDEYVALGVLLALVVGITRLAIGLLRAGVVAYLVSRPMLLGFLLRRQS